MTARGTTNGHRGLQGDRFAGKTVRPGDTVRVDLKVSETVTHQPARIPVIVTRATRPGPTVYVTSAIHGDEINGVAIVRRILDTASGHLERGTLIAVPVGNRFGFYAGDRYLPDRRDLNRHFPGDAAGHMADRIAYELFRRVVMISDLGVDLHTAAEGNTNLCHIRGDADIPAVRELMEAFGAPIMVHGAGPSGSLRRAATEAGVPTILFEAGEPGRFERHAVDFGEHGLLRLFGRVGLLATRRRPAPFQALVRKAEWIRSDHGGILDLRVEPGDLVRPGLELGVIFDPYGRQVDVLQAPRAGVVLGVATTPLVHPGMAVVHLGRLGRDFAAARRYVKQGQDLGHVHWRP
ncbi:MAG: succinylglutamate desuccinylase/aspartoacylase family protein [Thermoplasmatota archaeon]